MTKGAGGASRRGLDPTSPTQKVLVDVPRHLSSAAPAGEPHEQRSPHLLPAAPEEGNGSRFAQTPLLGEAPRPSHDPPPKYQGNSLSEAATKFCSPSQHTSSQSAPILGSQSNLNHQSTQKIQTPS